MNTQNSKFDFNPDELDKYLDLRQNLKSTFAEKLIFTKRCSANNKVYYIGIGNPFALIADYREDYWYPERVFYNSMGDYLENSSLTRVNMDFEIKNAVVPIIKKDNTVEEVASSMYAMRTLNGRHYRIVKSIRQISKSSHIGELKYTLYMVDGSHGGRIGEDLTITSNDFLNQDGDESDLFDEPIPQSEEMEQINIRYIIPWLEKISNKHNKKLEDNIVRHLEIIDDKDRSFIINCKNFAELQRRCDELIKDDVLFLVAPNFGIGCINKDIVEIAIKK